ncbi:MAG: hypothetical protein AB1938_15105 [Myxococcota bacterium]
MLALLALAGCAKEKSAEPAAAGAPKAPASREERPEYVVELLPGEAVAAGTEGAVVVHVAGKGHYHVNADYPLAFTPDPVDGLRFKDKRIALSESAEKTMCSDSQKDVCEVRAKAPFIADKAATLSGLLAFSICEPERCLIEKVRLAVSVPVK